MPTVDAERVFEMAAAEDEGPVEAVGADGPHPAFGESVRVWRADRCADQLDPLGAEHIIEPAAELPIPIVNEQPEGLVIAELHDEVARLLGDPASIRVRGAGDVLDPSRRQRDEEENVDA